MGFFKRQQPSAPAPEPVSEPPASKTCVCGATMPADDLLDHIDTHIVEVITAAGHAGRTYDCPLCGRSSEPAYGQPGEHPMSLKKMSRYIFLRHCRDAHGADL